MIKKIEGVGGLEIDLRESTKCLPFTIDIVSWKVCKPSPGRHKVSCFSSLKFTENKNENIHKSEAQETDEQTSIDK